MFGHFILSFKQARKKEMNKEKKSLSFDKILRILTVAPFMALIMFTIIYALSPELTTGLGNYFILVSFVVIFPLLAYPLQRFIPGFKGKGRRGQRNLAIIMSFAGYIFCTIIILLIASTRLEKLISVTYLFSGILMALFNKAVKINASGHACGIAGPIAVLTYIYGWYGLLALPLIVAVCVSSIRMKSHTLLQFVSGAIISVASMFIVILIF